MSQYQLEGNRFYFQDYDKLPAFSSFLPGVAGISGIPLWVFYTNRGQGVNSFGIHHKGNAIMEFNPANTAYENTPTKGFRTFLRKDGEYFEPFFGYSRTAERTMCVQKNSFSITQKERGLRICVSYFVLPTEEIGALVRRVDIENISGKTCVIEGIDGLPKIIPYGIQNGQFKEMSNLFKSWTDIKNIENNVPYYAMRASSDDSAEVSEIRGGYFYCTAVDGELLPVIYDAETIFDYESSLATPVVFLEEGLRGVRSRRQCFANKVPCGFTPFEKELSAGGTFSFTSYIGYAGTVEQLNETAKRFMGKDYAKRKETEAAGIIDGLVKDVATKTADPVFDQYMEQCYLDNFLRGGYPYLFEGEGKKNIVHLFSRKHGDPERDYNFFSISGEYYSQGNGNFRDVCQNRRNDVFFHPEIGDFNIYSFFCLIQADGYNPLEIRPCTFLVEEKNKGRARELVEEQVCGEKEALFKLLGGKFTPGQICTVMAEHGMEMKKSSALEPYSQETLIAKLLELSTEQLEAGFGEGYWSDHWDYLMDLVENYLLIFPDRKQELLTGRADYRFYDSAGQVRPRRETYVLNKGKVRQYGSMFHNVEKEKKEGFLAGGTNWMKDEKGNVITTTLLGKMLTLALNKFLLLDQEGMGIEMEGGKPGWNDAMNGLPGLFGSSMAETLELNRLLAFLEGSYEDGSIAGFIDLPFQIAALLESIEKLLQERSSRCELENWDAAASLRESYRAVVYTGMSGEVVKVTAKRIYNVVKDCHKAVLRGIERALKIGNGVLPTYFTYEVTEYEQRKDEEGNPQITPYGLPGIQAKAFTCHAVVPFLEGPARMLSCLDGYEEEKRQMCKYIKNSDLYDKKLKMYKTSGSIEGLSMEHGRVRAFTPGWLERESIFLHMEYKYLLGLLRAGLVEEFYTAMHDALIPFLPPERYGRSTLENSSFLASSANPDEKVHGRGFVARLSGSTTEMLSIWIRMFIGEGGFYMEDGALSFRLSPLLADWIFDVNGDAAFTLFSSCNVTYHNGKQKATYGTDGAKVVRITLHYADGREEEISGDTLKSGQAVALRDGKIDRIKAWLS
ncbi:MAG: cellobiose phosphorylase [Lachnospiraceae bacterium]|nr:cellobiose phosphorylase [Lachnospiraceae bacterium]